MEMEPPSTGSSIAFPGTQRRLGSSAPGSAGDRSDEDDIELSSHDGGPRDSGQLDERGNDNSSTTEADNQAPASDPASAPAPKSLKSSLTKSKKTSVAVFIVTLLGLGISAVLVQPSFLEERYSRDSTNLAVWEAAKDFQSVCPNLLTANNFSAFDCHKALDMVLPPPFLFDSVAENRNVNQGKRFQRRYFDDALSCVRNPSSAESDKYLPTRSFATLCVFVATVALVFAFAVRLPWLIRKNHVSRSRDLPQTELNTEAVSVIEKNRARQDLVINQLLAHFFDQMSGNLPRSTEGPVSAAMIPAPKRIMQASVTRGTFDMFGIMMEYCWSADSAGPGSKHSFLFRLKFPGPKVLSVRLRGHLSWSKKAIPKVNMKVQRLIPEDSEIFKACKAGSTLAVRELLRTRKATFNDITPSNETLLTAACDSREVELVELLLTIGADPNQTCGKMQTSPLQVAFELKDPELARRLLCYGADCNYIDARGWNVVHHLWKHKDSGHGEAHDELYHICAAVGFAAYDAQDTSGWTCLHRAAAYGTPLDIEDLLRLGTSLLVYTTPNAWSPIHVAALTNNVKTLRALSRHVNLSTLHSPDAHGWTPLHIAIEREAEDTMRFLLENGADPHSQTSITATWFPVGLENQILRPTDLALNCCNFFFEIFFEALKDAGWQVTTSLDNEDLYWDSQEYLDSPPQ